MHKLNIGKVNEKSEPYVHISDEEQKCLIVTHRAD